MNREAKVCLLVDDDEAVRNMLGEMVRAAGYECVTCDTPSKAVQEAKTRKGLSVVISDVEMPEMDGFELAKHLRDLSLDVKIVFVTGSQRKPPAGLDDCPVLIKPVAFEALRKALQFGEQTRKALQNGGPA